MKSIRSILFYQRNALVLLLLFFAAIAIHAVEYPAKGQASTTLNVRSGPGTNYAIIGQLQQNEEVIVNGVIDKGISNWGMIDYKGQTGYASAKYLLYIGPIEEQEVSSTLYSNSNSTFSIASFFEGAWKVIKFVFIALLVLLVLGFWKEILQIILYVAMMMGIGALIFHFAFDNANLGASIGFVVAVLIGAKMIVDYLGIYYSSIMELIYRLVSFPIWFLNRLQHILMEPWRYITKWNIPDGVRDVLRPIAYPVEIILYILITPLRFVNAVIYNIFVYGITELYDLFFEVLQPSSYREGRGDFILWIIWFPVRLVKYPILRGCLVLIEGAIWTVIDIFIPTITMYHGTDLTAAQAIVGNDWHKGTYKKWTDGTFCSSKYGWAGAGVYFGSSRRTARRYACDEYRLSDNNPVMIVCRVSLGKILNYGLAPRIVSENTGEYGTNSNINLYANKYGYTTGEWWNDWAGYWEYCMFDWQNAYNQPWRIRPIYVFNFRTGIAQHIDGGFRHWLFSKVVIDDMMNSPRFLCLLIIAVVAVIWFIYCGWQILWYEYLWYYWYYF